MQQSFAQFAERLSTRAMGRRVPSPTFTLTLSVEFDDDPEAVAVAAPEEPEGHLFIIDYRDVRGRVTSRRVTVMGVIPGAGGIPLLQCHCHERGADRQFRTDRILTCYDMDGVVHEDVPAFLYQALGLPIAATVRTEGFEDRNAWPRIRSQVRPHATLLSAISHADDFMCDEEVLVIVDHCEATAGRAEFVFPPDTRELFERYVRRQRPTREAIWRCCDMMRQESPQTVLHFLQSAAAVMEADNFRHPEEVVLLNDMALELTGVPLI